MPDEETIERAREDEREGKSPSTQAGEFVREEMDHIREGKHGARNTKQAIAIGLSKARRAGVKLPPPKQGSNQIRRKAEQDLEKGESRGSRETSVKRSRAISGVLKREGHAAASHSSLSRQAKSSARKRGAGARHNAAMKAVRTKGASGVRQTAKKAAKTRSRGNRAA